MQASAERPGEPAAAHQIVVASLPSTEAEVQAEPITDRFESTDLDSLLDEFAEDVAETWSDDELSKIFGA